MALDLGDYDWQLWALDQVDPSTYNDVEIGTVTVSPDLTHPGGDPIGWVTIDFSPSGDGDIERLPVFAPRAVEYPMVRIYLPHINATAAFNIAARSEASHPELSIDTHAGVWAVDDGGYTHPADVPDDPLDPPEGPDPPEDPEDPEEPGDDPGSAVPDTVVEHFDHSLGPYEGDRRNYDITTRWGHHSTPSLIHNSSDYVGGLMWSPDGLPNYLERGDRGDIYWRTSHGSRDLSFGATGDDDRVYHRVLFCMHDREHYYAASVAVNNERMNLAEKTANTSWNVIATSDTKPIPANTRLRTGIGLHPDGRLGMGLYNDRTEESLGGIPFTPPQHHDAVSGGIGWNHTVYKPDCELITDAFLREPGHYE